MADVPEVAKAYAAGLIDGEGSIYVCRGSRGQLIIRVAVVMTDRSPLDFLALWFGQTVHERAGRTITGRPTYEWRAAGRKAQAFLEVINEHLVLKSPQARLAMQFPMGSAGQRLGDQRDPIYIEREKIKGLIHNMNHTRKAG